MRIGPLEPAALGEAQRVLAAACAFDRAADVAEEKLFGAAPQGPSVALGAWDGEALVGVAALTARWVRVLAVEPRARGRGIGSGLLAACEAHARAHGEISLSALDLPGNYLAPGIDVDNVDTLAWLARRGWTRGPDLRTNVLIDVRDNPRVSAARAASLAAVLAARGYRIRRAHVNEVSLLDWVEHEFGGAWRFELVRAMATGPVGVHVALAGGGGGGGGAYCAFAAHDANNRGLGWFGPTGTCAAHRGQGLGEALLLACLVDVGAEHAQCEVAWIGPRAFYDKVAGVARDRHFAVLRRAL